MRASMQVTGDVLALCIPIDNAAYLPMASFFAGFRGSAPFSPNVSTYSALFFTKLSAAIAVMGVLRVLVFR